MSNEAPRAAGLDGVRHVIMVLSGKGGVGKSTVACQLAFTLASAYGKRVGVMDVDLCGPSVAKICGAENADVFNGPTGMVPVPVTLSNAVETTGELRVMSIAFLLSSPNDAVVWRGPKKDAMIKQFVNNVAWGDLDYLIVDTPPGTSDEHLTLCEMLRGRQNATGAVVVTTPQNVSADDVRKELSFCHQLNVRCLGIVENMSGFVCPHCAECTAIFSSGAGKQLAEMYDVPFLGAIPIEPGISLAEDEGQSYTSVQGGSEAAKSAFVTVVDAFLAQVTRADSVVSASETTAAAKEGENDQRTNEAAV